MNKRSVDIESAANLGKIVKAGTKTAPIKKAAVKKQAGKSPVKKANAEKKAEETKQEGKAYQPALPGMRNLNQFKGDKASSKPAHKVQPNKVASNGKTCQPTFPGMSDSRKFKA